MKLPRKRSLIFLGAITSALATGVAVYSVALEKRWIELVELELPISRLTPAFKGYRIAHLSDLHMDGIGLNLAHLVKTIEWVNSLQPDLVVLTGDYVNFMASHFAPQVARGLSVATAPDGVIGVMGNHDHSTDVNAVERAFKDAGIITLRNEVTSVERQGMHGTERLIIGGVDDKYNESTDLDAVMAAMPDDYSPAIMLSHMPDFADESAATGRFDLQLSGHSHAGQVRLPFMEPIWLPPYGRKYWEGLYQVGDMWQYTNRGLGTCVPNVRFNCRPEVTLFTLTCPA